MIFKKGQVSMEFMIGAIIATFLLAVGISVYIQQTITSEQIAEANSDLIQCNKISDIISRIYASHAITQETLAITAQTTIQRTGNVGQIIVGTQSCNYFGNAAIDDDLINGSNPRYKDNQAATGFVIGAGATNWTAVPPTSDKRKFKLVNQVYSGKNFVVFVPQN